MAGSTTRRSTTTTSSISADFLKESAQYELAAQSDSRVVGVYVGWPGKSLRLGEPAISATFWDRKIAAQHVAVGSVRELTAQLRAPPRECAQWALEPASAARTGRQHRIRVRQFAGAEGCPGAGRWPLDAAGRPLPMQFGRLALTPLHGGLGSYRDTDPNMPLWNVTTRRSSAATTTSTTRCFARSSGSCSATELAARSEPAPAAKLQLPR